MNTSTTFRIFRALMIIGSFLVVAYTVTMLRFAQITGPAVLENYYWALSALGVGLLIGSVGFYLNKPASSYCRIVFLGLAIFATVEITRSCTIEIPDGYTGWIETADGSFRSVKSGPLLRNPDRPVLLVRNGVHKCESVIAVELGERGDLAFISTYQAGFIDLEGQQRFVTDFVQEERKRHRRAFDGEVPITLIMQTVLQGYFERIMNSDEPPTSNEALTNKLLAYTVLSVVPFKIYVSDLALQPVAGGLRGRIDP